MSLTEVWKSRSKLAYWRNTAARPDFWLTVVCSVLVVWAAGQLLFFGFGRDQSIYALVGRGILEGDMPYRERWDFKPPGVFLVYALAEAVFGKVMWGVRLLEAVGLLVSVWLMVSLSQTFFADRRPGYVAAALASVLHVQLEFWHTGQPESFAGFLTVMALAAVSGRTTSRGGKYGRWAFAGLCFGGAFLLKPPLGGGAVVAAVFLLKQEWDEANAAHKGTAGSSVALALPFLIIGLGALVPIAVVAVWFWITGAWGDLAWTLFEFTPGYTKLGWTNNAAGGFYRAVESALTKHSALLALGLVAAGFGGPISTREREGLGLVLGVLAMQLAGIGMQAKYFEYHYGASMPLLAFVAGLGWFKIWRAATREHGGGAVAFASLVVVVGMARLPVYDVPEGFWVRAWERTKGFFGASQQKSQYEWDKRFHFCADFNLSADREVAEWLKANGGAQDTTFVWGFEPAIYWFLERPLASRFIYDVPQRVGWEHERARRELLDDLERAKPTWFVVQHHDYFNFVTGNDFDSRAALDHDAALSQWVNASYLRVEQIEDFEIYRRTPTSP